MRLISSAWRVIQTLKGKVFTASSQDKEFEGVNMYMWVALGASDNALLPCPSSPTPAWSTAQTEKDNTVSVPQTRAPTASCTYQSDTAPFPKENSENNPEIHFAEWDKLLL